MPVRPRPYIIRCSHIAILLASHGCTREPQGMPVREAMRNPPGVATQNTTHNAASDGGPVVATVNGKPIARAELVELLVESRGPLILQQLVLREVAMQEADKNGIMVTESDFVREYELMLAPPPIEGEQAEKLDPTRRKQLIVEWTRSRGVSPQELDIAVQRQAYLRKIAEKRITVDPAQLDKQLAATQGEKIEIRHIQLAAARYYPELKSRLDSGQQFEDLVRLYSQNVLTREKKGLLPAFSVNDPTVPQVFIETAGKLQPGQYSELVEAEGSYHVIKLERRIAASETANTDQRKKAEEAVRARLVAEEMEKLNRDLLKQANLHIDDPALRDQYAAKQKSGELLGPAAGGG